MRLNHVTLPATDVEASAEFYRRLGLSQIVASYPKYARFVSPEGGVTLSLHSNELPIPSATSIHFEVDVVDQTIAYLRDAASRSRPSRRTSRTSGARRHSSTPTETASSSTTPARCA